MRTLEMSEDEARALDICPACGREKSFSGLVCWDCFKGGGELARIYNREIEPLKYAYKSFEEWFNELPWDLDVESAVLPKLEVLRQSRRAGMIGGAR